MRPHYYGFYKHIFQKFHLFENKKAKALYDGDIWMNLHLDDFIQQQIYLLGYYDEAGILFLKKHISPGSVFVDIGANVGCYTLIASKIVGQKGKVFAFEPSLRVHEQLTANIAMNAFQNIQVEKIALFNETSKLSLKLSSSANMGMSSVHAHDEETGEVEIVDAVKGDDYFLDKKIEKIDLLKMDIEGAELFALEGLQQTLRKYRPLLILEMADEILEKAQIQKSDLIQFMKNCGYQIMGMDTEGEIVSVDSKNLNDSDNYVFVPE